MGLSCSIIHHTHTSCSHVIYRSIEMIVGSSDYNHHGGSIQLSAGKTKGNARGGSVDIAAGDGTAKKGGRGGSLTLTAGDAFGDDPSDNGGDLTMIGGSANGGVGGSMKLQTGSSNEKDSGAIGKLLKCLVLLNPFFFSLCGILSQCCIVFTLISHCHIRFWPWRNQRISFNEYWCI